MSNIKPRAISHAKITPRLFSNGVMEKLSQVHPITPLVLYLPLVLYGLSVGIRHQSLVRVGLFWFLGVFVWTFVEYSIHRFVFHYEPRHRFGRRLHFIIHGVHHQYPSDPMRLVMPPVISMPMAVVFYVGLTSLFGSVHPWPFASGFVLGYLAYDMTHYALHHFSLKNSQWGLWLKRYHLRHHFRDERRGFGVSSPLWDYVLRTQPIKPHPAAKPIRSPRDTEDF